MGLSVDTATVFTDVHVSQVQIELTHWLEKVDREGDLLIADKSLQVLEHLHRKGLLSIIGDLAMWVVSVEEAVQDRDVRVDERLS